MIILWDLHEVVFHRTTKDWVRTFFRFKKKKAIIRNLSGGTIKLLSYFILSKLRATKKEVTSEELLMHARTSNNKALVELVHQFSAHYQPDPHVADLILSLNKQGYTQHIGSNIGPTLLKTLEDDFPEIMACFSYAHVVTCPQDNRQKVIKKPDPAFFHTYLATQTIAPEKIIFIDDKEKNVQAARMCGITGILFKNGLTLKKELSEKVSI